MANNLIGLLELFFPHSIDILEKEVSPVDGPKPIVFELGSDIEMINHFLFDILKSSMFDLGNEDDNNNNAQFGCNQVIIVKNEETKEKVQKLFKHA